ncbi:MAG: hypothetical protein IJE00_01260 [Clostridia bacterium]|nr:hypothetical protein [Clostridia bacterium]
MTILEAITTVDGLKPNTVPPEQKKRWLSVVDSRITLDIHAHFDECPTFTEYDENTPDDTKLLVPTPYDEIYVYWLMAQIDFVAGEEERYNNEIAVFNTDLQQYERYYRQRHKTKPVSPRFF